MSEETIPTGYAETLDCLNKPESWETRGMIADMAEYLRQGLDVPPGQLLAALDWMTWRLQESRDILVDSDSELSAIAHGRPIDKQESTRISDECRKLTGKLRGW